MAGWMDRQLRLRKRVKVTKIIPQLLFKIGNVGKEINFQYHEELSLGHKAFMALCNLLGSCKLLGFSVLMDKTKIFDCVIFSLPLRSMILRVMKNNEEE